MLRVEKASVHYGHMPALVDVNIAVGEGEFVGVIGSNRAGKSTLIKAISNLVKVSSGSIYVDGVSTLNTAPHLIPTLGIAHVPEGRHLFPGLNVEENLRLGAILPAAKIKRAAGEELVYGIFPRLKNRRKQIAGTLSGGEQQMLAIARGLMLQPRLLMLDEPSLGLAPILVSEVYEKISEIQNFGMAVLLIEQNVNLTLEVISRGYVLENGKVVLEGTADDLKSNPAIKEAYLGL